MDNLHSIGFFYYNIVIAPKYRPVQIVYDDYPPCHNRIRFLRMQTNRKGATVLDQRL